MVLGFCAVLHCWPLRSARRDEDGYLWLMGRVDDVMNVSGHRISTIEVESALVDHKDEDLLNHKGTKIAKVTKFTS